MSKILEQVKKREKVEKRRKECDGVDGVPLVTGRAR